MVRYKHVRVHKPSRLELLSISSVIVFFGVGMLCKIELLSVIQQNGEKVYNMYCKSIDWRDSSSTQNLHFEHIEL